VTAGENFAAPERAVIAARAAVVDPHRWALAGEWTIRPDAVVLDEPGGRLACCFPGPCRPTAFTFG
jgi:hypothetical protein